jgi:hemolysin activation/secretion protein
VAEDWALGGRLALQRTNDLLVQGEQFGLGGIATVRGYGERELAGDQGISASLELVTPRLGLAEQAPGVDLRGVAFADGGQVANHGDLACLPQQTRCTLASLGVGLRLDWGPVQGRLYVAQAQRDGNGTRAGEWRTQFAVTANY